MVIVLLRAQVCAREIAETAVEITLDALPEHLASEQLDAILGMVGEALRAHLEKRIMERREYRSELFRGIYRQGESEGEARGKAESILAVLAAREIPVSDAIRERVLACADLATLDVWIRRAAVASTAASVVRAKAPSRRRTTRVARRT